MLYYVCVPNDQGGPFDSFLRAGLFTYIPISALRYGYAQSPLHGAPVFYSIGSTDVATRRYRWSFSRGSCVFDASGNLWLNAPPNLSIFRSINLLSLAIPR